MEISKILGKLVAAFPAITFGRLYYREMDIQKTEALKHSKGNYRAKMTLNSRSLQDLIWWKQNLNSSRSTIQNFTADYCLKTDASNLGFGGISGKSSLSGQWQKFEQNLHINQKELLAVKYCLERIFDEYRNCTIKILTDNTVTMHYVSNMGGKILNFHRIVKQIWEWAISRDIWLISCFIPGKINVEADRLSRLLNETTEWSLSQNCFTKILHKYPEISVDLFASHLNYKLPKYVSWLPDNQAFACNAFSIKWTTFLGYVFPPFNLIGRVLKKVELEGCNVILVVPEWRSQYWFSKLESMLIDEPLFLPRSRSTLVNPVNAQATPVKSRLMVCNIGRS